MTTEIKELSRAYQLWLIIKDNPGIKMADVAKAMGSHTKNISDAITKMVKAGNICTQGKKGIRTYTVNKSSPPVMYGRGSYKLGCRFTAEMRVGLICDMNFWALVCLSNRQNAIKD